MSSQLKKVTRQHPCPICGKPDWCKVTADGGAVKCMRVESKCPKNGGWWHILDESTIIRKPRIIKMTTADIPAAGKISDLAARCERVMTAETYAATSRSLGVSVESLRRLHVGTDGRALTFPMKNTRGEVVGIRRRLPNGKKFSVKGYRNGLFVPDGLSGTDSLLVVEGNTDCAAGLDLGFDVIGRPSCRGHEVEIAEICRGRHTVIVADNDAPKKRPNGATWRPGIEGANALAARLVFACPSVRIVLPPLTVKDLRGWLRAGLTRAELVRIIENTKPLSLELAR